MNTSRQLTEHYRHGSLEQAVLEALRAAGKDPERLAPGDMLGMDEFHAGGAEATRELAGRIGVRPGMRLLDIGSGLGGPARHFAGLGCQVTGVDLSGEFVAVAQLLTERMGMADRVAFRQGDAAAMDLAPGSFDAATLLHVGMNIADKPALFAAVYRALKPGGVFAIYDVMAVGAGNLDFPVPWSSGPETSFVETPMAYRAALERAGFAVVGERDRGDFARAGFAAMRARVAQAGGKPVGVQVVMGADGPRKAGNMAGMIERGVIAPVEMLGRK